MHEKALQAAFQTPSKALDPGLAALGSGRTRQRLLAPHCSQSCRLWAPATAKTSRQAACSKANNTLNQDWQR